MSLQMTRTGGSRSVPTFRKCNNFFQMFQKMTLNVFLDEVHVNMAEKMAKI